MTFAYVAERWHFLNDEGRLMCNGREPADDAETWTDPAGPPEPRCRLCVKHAGFPG